MAQEVGGVDFRMALSLAGLGGGVWRRIPCG
jgi:hypothetical protein